MFYNSKFILSWKVMFSKWTEQWTQSSTRHNVTPSSDIYLTSMWWGCIGSLDMLEYEVMRSPTSSQGAALFWGFLDLTCLWSLKTRYTKKDQSFDRQPTLDTMARSWQYPKTGSRTNFGTFSGCQGQVSVRLQDSIQGCYWLSHWT